MNLRTLFVGIALLFALLFAGCSTDTGNIHTDRRHAVELELGRQAVGVIGRAAFATLASVAQSELRDGKADWGHTASNELWKQEATIANADSVERLINAATLNHIPATAKVAAVEFSLADPQTPAQRQAAANALANTISAEALKVTEAEAGP